MNWPAEQVAATSLWRFAEAHKGWRLANGVDKPGGKAPSPSDLAAFYERNGVR